MEWRAGRMLIAEAEGEVRMRDEGPAGPNGGIRYLVRAVGGGADGDLGTENGIALTPPHDRGAGHRLPFRGDATLHGARTSQREGPVLLMRDRRKRGREAVRARFDIDGRVRRVELERAVGTGKDAGERDAL